MYIDIIFYKTLDYNNLLNLRKMLNTFPTAIKVVHWPLFSFPFIPLTL